MWDRYRDRRLLPEAEASERTPEPEPVLRSFLGSPERFRAFHGGEDAEAGEQPSD
jgi:hypothetical protein